jgi:hypothetical protein
MLSGRKKGIAANRGETKEVAAVRLAAMRRERSDMERRDAL